MKLGLRALFLILAWSAFVSPAARAQEGGLTQGAPPPPPPPPPAPTGYPVTGRVTCADTQHAARFAQVTLIGAADSEGGFRGGGRLSARTDLDGNFVMPAVSPGDYYVTASMTGYVNTATLVQNALSAGGDPGPALAGVPLVHVGAGGGTTALSLQRGGVIAGAVQWDDGSPAAGIGVSAQPVPASSAAGVTSTTLAQLPATGRGPGGGFNGSFAGSQTDDRGHFRLSGLAPGSYYLRASVQAPAPVQGTERSFGRLLTLSVYAPDKVRRTDATPIVLAAGEERNDVNVLLGLAALHNVSGIVSASSASVHSGTVNLTDQTDSTLNRTGTIAPDGSFVVPYVPAGNYTLRVNASSQAASFGRGGISSDPGVRFSPVQASVTVADTDLTGLAVTVTPATSSP